MRKLLLTFVLTIISSASAFAETAKDIDEQATHEQTALIKVVNDRDETLQVNTFCLDAQGHILAGCGNGPGEVRIYDEDGRYLETWETTIKPEAINVDPNGTILIAGSGKLQRYNDKGLMISEAAAPHLAGSEDAIAKLRESVVKQMTDRTAVYERQIGIYEKQIETLKAKEEPTKVDEQRIAAYERTIKSFKETIERLGGQKEPSEEQIDAMVKAQLASKTKVASISTDGKSVYVATPAMVGYGFDVWKVDNEFANPESIVTGLRGCCGQMDVQASTNGIYVAENSRHRVVCFDGKGEEVRNWGKRDREGIEGFTSCCNPMNLCFGKTGDVYTAESNTGRIKQFSADGELIAYVGDVKLVPGCKKVSIAVSADSDRVYMLDITRNHIVMMKRKTAEAKIEKEIKADVEEEEAEEAVEIEVIISSEIDSKIK